MRMTFLLFMCALITFACEPVDSNERRRRHGNGRRTANAQLDASGPLIRPNFPLQNRVSMVKHSTALPRAASNGKVNF